MTKYSNNVIDNSNGEVPVCRAKARTQKKERKMTGALDLLNSLGGDVDATITSQPLVLCYADVDASRIESVRVIRNNPRREPDEDDPVKKAIDDGYMVVSVLCVRDDNISYGAANAAAAVHAVITVLVKLKQQDL